MANWRSTKPVLNFIGCLAIAAVTILTASLCLIDCKPYVVIPSLLLVIAVGSILSALFLPPHFRVPTVFVATCFVATAMLLYHLHWPTQDGFTPTREQLENVHEWLWTHSPNENNRAERRKNMNFIQTACDQLKPSVYDDYYVAGQAHWYKNLQDPRRDASLKELQTTSELESQYPALYYLHIATEHAIKDIRKTHVKRGLAVWYIYNMGYIFKTPEHCFAIDLNLANSERLVEDLDFLLLTHGHGDHWSLPLVMEMAKAGKPVIQRLRAIRLLDTFEDLLGKTAVEHPAEFHFGAVRVKVDIGDHGDLWPHRRTNDMLMFQVDCGQAANSCTIYHTGDGGNLDKMRPDRRVDILIGCVQAGTLSIKKMIRHLKPRMTLVSHVLELGHSPKLPRPYRWSFNYAFRAIKNVRHEATVLTWGERWLLPGTVLQEPESN